MSLIAKIIRITRKPFQQASGLMRLWSLKWQTRINGGRIIVGKGVKVNQRVIFQGKGTLVLGDKVKLGYHLGGSPTIPILLQPRDTDSVIEIGPESSLANGTEIICRERVTIGRKCLIGARCVILDSDFHGVGKSVRRIDAETSPIRIGNNVWLGLGVTILKAVKVGDDCVIGARSVVTKEVLDGQIAVGIPARIIGSVYDV